MEIGGVSPEGVAVPELGVTPLMSPDTELEDELPTPDYSPLLQDSSPEGVRRLGIRPAPRDLVDMELEKALLDTASYGDASRGATGGFSGGSVYVSGASSACPAV